LNNHLFHRLSRRRSDVALLMPLLREVTPHPLPSPPKGGEGKKTEGARATEKQQSR
jgi:hypothetical protein